MAVKGILFNTEMVRAILDGRKTCTRRIVKPQITAHYGAQCIKPPYQPGDILYIQETWERFECRNCEGDEKGNCPKEPKKSVLDKTCGCYMYRATDEKLFPYRSPDPEQDLDPTDWCTNATDVEVSELGKTVFLNREEAKKKLKEMKK
jgi:hypothetical protein